MRDSVQLIKERLSIIDVVAPYVQLQKAGRHLKGKSPFTNEKTPSFFVSPDRGMYYCFSSSKGGDIFTFIEEMEGVDFKGALKILAERANVELVPEDPKKKTEREELHSILEEGANFYSSQLSKKKTITEYLLSRAVSETSIEAWRIGYAPDAWRDLKEYLMGRGHSEALLLRAGLIKKSEEGENSYDVFRDRVMFPIFDASGRVVAFSGRALKSDPETPKYVNSPETELYQKSEILFGYHKAKEGIRKMDFSLIVEGQFDLVLAHQAGYRNTVAISGTALTEHHAALLQRLSDRTVLALDADEAGIASVKRAATVMLARGMDVKVALIPKGKDPADLVADDPQKLKEVIGKASHVIEFLIELIKRDAPDERSYRLRVRDEVVPFLTLIPNHIDREHFETVIAEAIGTTKDAVHLESERFAEEEVGVTEVRDTASGQNVGKSTKKRYQELSRFLYSMLIWQESLPQSVIDTKKEKERLAQILGERIMTLMSESTEAAQNRATFEAEMLFEDDDAGRVQRQFSEMMEELEMLVLRERLKRARTLLSDAERLGESERAEELFTKCSELQRQISTLDAGEKG